MFPDPPREAVEDYNAYFHHMSSPLIVGPELVKRLRSGKRDDDDAGDGSAEGELVRRFDMWFSKIDVEVGVCAVFLDARQAVRAAVHVAGCAAGAKVLATLRAAYAAVPELFDAKPFRHEHWEFDALTFICGAVSTALLFALRLDFALTTLFGDGVVFQCSINYADSDVVLIERPDGRIHSETASRALNLADTAFDSNTHRYFLTRDARIALQREVDRKHLPLAEALLSDGSWVPLDDATGSPLREDDPKIKRPAAYISDLRHGEWLTFPGADMSKDDRLSTPKKRELLETNPWTGLISRTLTATTKAVVMATFAFDAALEPEAGSPRLYVERRRAVEVVQAAFKKAGGWRGAGEDGVYFFETASRALVATLDARRQLHRFLFEEHLSVRPTGFGITFGQVLCASPYFVGDPVKTAAHLCYEISLRALPGGIFLSRAASRAAFATTDDERIVRHRYPNLNVVPTFLKVGDRLDEFAHIPQDTPAPSQPEETCGTTRHHPRHQLWRKKRRSSSSTAAAEVVLSRQHDDATSEVDDDDQDDDQDDECFVTTPGTVKKKKKSSQSPRRRRRSSSSSSRLPEVTPNGSPRTQQRTRTSERKATSPKQRSPSRTKKQHSGKSRRRDDMRSATVRVVAQAEKALEEAIRNGASQKTIEEHRAALRELQSPALAAAQVALDEAIRSGASQETIEEHRAALRELQAPALAAAQLEKTLEETIEKHRAALRELQSPTMAATAASKLGKLGGAWTRYATAAAEWVPGKDPLPTVPIGTDPKTADELAVVLASLRKEDPSDEEIAAEAANLRARIEYLRSRCDDPAALDAAIAADPRLLCAGPNVLARVEAYFRRPSLSTDDDDSDDGQEKADEEEDDQGLAAPLKTAAQLKKKKSSKKRKKKRRSKTPSYYDDENLSYSRRVNLALIREVLLSPLLGDEPFKEYNVFLVDAIHAERPDLLLANLITLAINQLEYLYGGILMAKHGFTDKYAEQIDHRLVVDDDAITSDHTTIHTPAAASSSSSKASRRDDASGPYGSSSSAKSSHESLDVVDTPKDTKQNDSFASQKTTFTVVERFQAKLYACGRAVFLDQKSGFAFPLMSYAFGPTPDLSDTEKMQRDFILALRSHESLPMPLKKLVKYLRTSGWPDTPDDTWSDLVLSMFDHGIIGIGSRHDGTPVEVW